MRTFIRAAFTTALVVAMSAPAYPQERGYWLPDRAVVANIEHDIAQLPLRTKGSWRAAALETYARYYTGITLEGRKVVYGVFLSMDPQSYPPSVHIVQWSDQPEMTGGGCTQLNLWYDVGTAKITEFHCYGLG